MTTSNPAKSDRRESIEDMILKATPGQIQRLLRDIYRNDNREDAAA